MAVSFFEAHVTIHILGLTIEMHMMESVHCQIFSQPPTPDHFLKNRCATRGAQVASMATIGDKRLGDVMRFNREVY